MSRSETPLPKLMISYSRVDLEFALRLVRDLKALDINVWLDRVDIPAGSNWDVEIENALAAADVVLVVVSQNSAKSENVENEISHALESGKQVVPLTIDAGPVPLMITRVQREDFRGDYDAALRKLVVRIKGVGRTEALNSVTLEEVQALKEESVRRLARRGEHADRPSFSDNNRASAERLDASERPSWASRGSVDPAVTSLPAIPAPRRSRAGWVAGSVAAVVLLAGSGLYFKEQRPKREARRPREVAMAAAAVLPEPPPVQSLAVPVAAPLILAAAEAVNSGASAAVELTASAAPLGSALTAATEATGTLHPAATADLPAAGSAKVAPLAPELPKVVHKSTPLRLRGTWFQKCTVTAEDSLRSDLIFGKSTLQLIINRYPLANHAPCTGGFVRNTEEFEVDKIEEYEGGVYAVNLRVKSLLVMPSSIAYTLNSQRFAGRTDWVNTQQVNVLGARSLGYFEHAVASDTLLYGSWRLREGKLRFMWAKDMATEPEKRPAIPADEWAFEAKQ